jgi:hypothetical protein
MATIDTRARINRRALECPDTSSFQGTARMGPPGAQCCTTMQIDRTEATVVYLKRSDVIPAPVRSAPLRP